MQQEQQPPRKMIKYVKRQDPMIGRRTEVQRLGPHNKVSQS
uniref:Uncharacterized protein n=1 Tax=Melanopsichium pennsylvanicum 4 TaxID=1398559 RepID=A0A077RE22_9BASI|nr:uncharacterized protein BN887_01750 [Melanopsichium pennsylvanicum 4]